MPYTKSGKCGSVVWQRARYGQICYAAFVPYNPRSAAQMAVRDNFRAVSARWKLLSQAQRDLWDAVGRTKWSRPRLGRGRLTGFNLFMKVNVRRANRGQAQVDLPPGYAPSSEQAAANPWWSSRFDQAPVGPTLFLQTSRLIADWQHGLCEFPAVAPPAGG